MNATAHASKLSLFEDTFKSPNEKAGFNLTHGIYTRYGSLADMIVDPHIL